MDAYILSRVLHVLGVVLWIGGVAMVTTVLLPAARARSLPEEGLALFQGAERRFARQARLTTVLTGLTGFYMLHHLHGWGRYLQPQFWWLHAMTLVWIVFTLILFVIEPVVLRRWPGPALSAPGRVLSHAQRAHWVLLLLSLVAVAGAAAGAHGWP